MTKLVLKKLWKIATQAQVLAVFLAFALMVFLSYFFMGNIERNNLFKTVEEAIISAQASIEADLLEPASTLGIVSENTRSMILNGASLEDVSKYLADITSFILNDDKMMSYAAFFYGFFNYYGDSFVAVTDRLPQDEFIPRNRPWYKAAIEANGKVGVTEPYINLVTNELTLSFSRQIFGNDGEQLGVIVLDILLNRISEYAINTSVSNNSYGILLDKDFNVLAHPVSAYIGRNVVEMNDGHAIADEIRKEGKISERKAWDYNNKESVLFVRKLNNGWYLAVLTYADEYYKSVNEIAYLLTGIALILAMGLSAILLSMASARKRAEERTKLMLDATPLCAELWDKDQNIIDCNMEALKLFGFSDKNEYIGRFWELSPEYQPDGKLSSEKARSYLSLAFNDGYCRFEWLHRKINGELIPCEVTLVRVAYRNENIICGYTRDLRELRSMMTKMREADECTQILFNTSPLGCILIDNTINIIECNDEIVRLFKLENKLQFIQNASHYMPECQPSGERSKQRINKYINEAFEEGYCRFEWMHQKSDGEQFPSDVLLARVKYRGVYAVAGYIKDLSEIKAMIAEMKRAEIAEASSKAKSDFLAKMSHEIRTPMNAILGITEIQLRDNSLPLTAKEALERIYNSGELLLGIINDILDLSKIEAGKLELNRAQYDAASLLYDIAKLNIIRYENKPIEFSVAVNENTPKILIGDELRIKQILNNLLSNAFKYTQIGRIDLILDIKPCGEDDKIIIVFTVRDTGQGMTEEQVKKLGTKYSRFNEEANRKTEGTGLGMNITCNLINLMNGEIDIQSEPGKGSVFTVSLPQIKAGDEVIGKDIAENLMKLNLKTPAKMRNLQISREYMPYGRVLIVDDVETNLYVARGLMAPYGLSIDTALSGYEAIEKINSGAVYDVIFMDHMMPKMDGIETVKKIRGTGYEHPIVALTANALAGQAEIFLTSGFNDFISKPIDVRQLNNVLNKYARDKQTQDTLDEAKRQKNSLRAQGARGIAVDPELAEYFTRDAEKASNVLETICENSLRGQDDISVFIINIHAMKSALANVGEKELSLCAADLEQAGRERNIKLILSGLPDFLLNLKSVIEKLKPREEFAEESSYNDDFPDKVFLQEKLLVIQAACASMDKKNAKKAVTALRQKTWPRSVRDLLSAISEHLLHSEFEEAAEAAKKINFT